MTVQPLIRRPWIAPAVSVASLAAAWLAWWSMPYDELRQFASETGPVEQATWILYFVMAVAFAVFARRGDRPSTRGALVVMMAAFGARELDWHKALTGKNVLKLSFYVDSGPLHQKLIALASLALILAALALLLRRHTGGVWRGVRRGDPVCSTVLVFVATMVISKVLDRSINVLFVDYGIVTPAATHALVGASEEILELALPLIAGIGLVQHLTQPNGGEGRRPAP